MRAIITIAALMLASSAQAASVAIAPYGTTNSGERVFQATLTNNHRMTVKLISFGATVTEIDIPDRRGKRANVVLGFGNLADYEARNSDPNFGATVGRFAGRIAKAHFMLAGREVKLAANDGPNTLHGGPGGTAGKAWRMTSFRHGLDVGALLRLDSPDGTQGFPGALGIEVRYTLTPANALRIDYRVTSDRPTVVNLTNHSYFNLAGAGSGTVLGHRLQLFSDRLVETDAGGIPTGHVLPVADSPFDFRTPKVLNATIDLPHPQMTGRRGYNHSWLLPFDGRLHPAARLSDPVSGRTLEVATTEPSLIVYTANWLGGHDVGAQRVPYRSHDAIALEAEHLPDSPNRPEYPSTSISPVRPFSSTTIYRFGVER